MRFEKGNYTQQNYKEVLSKMYSILLDIKKSIKRAKGVKKHVLKKEIIHEKYREVLSKKKTLHHPMNMIRQEFHRLYTIRVNKISLSAQDTMRYILKDGIHTLAYGHYKL